MTNKVELNTLSQVVHKEQAFLTALNENFDRIQEAINDTLSRSGVIPNQMEAPLDMNGQRIINAGTALEDNDVITKAYIEELIQDVQDAVTRADELINQAIAAVEVYANEHVYPIIQDAVDSAVAAKDAAKGYADDAKDYYDDTKDLYDDLADVKASLSSLLDLYNNLSYVIDVSNNMTDVQTVSGISSNVTTVAGISSAVSAVAGNSTNINAVNANKTNINKVATNINNINSVANSVANVNSVAASLSNVNSVAGALSDINTVAGDLSNIDEVAEISGAVSTVASNISKINSVVSNETNINTVASNISDVNHVSENMGKIADVYDDLSVIEAVNSNSTNINAVNNNKTNIDAVAGIASDVSTVASKASEVDTVATNISDVNTAAANIQAIQDAPTQASNAQKWAEGSDADVAALGGTHSAKGWANQEANNYSVTSTGSTTSRTLKDRFADVINVKDFGAKGDGVTDDTNAIQAAMTHANAGDTIFFPNGDYNVSTINITKRLNLTGGHIISNSVAITLNTSQKGGSIKNMVLDAPIGILVEGYVRNMLVENCMITNATTYGIWIKQGNEFMFKDGLIYLPNDQETTTGTAIKIDTWDCHFSNVVIQGYKTAIDCSKGANIFDKIHAWFAKQELFSGSVFMKIQGQNQISNCYSDGYQYVFNLYNNYYKLAISNMYVGFGGHDITSNIPVIFYSSSSTQDLVSGGNTIDCSGLEITQPESRVDFSNIESFCIEGFYDRNGYLGNYICKKPNGNSTKSNFITDIPNNLTVGGVGTSTISVSGYSYRPSGEKKETSGLTKDLSYLSDGTYLIITWGMSSLDYSKADQSFSGASQPSPTDTRAIWYDTNEEKLKITYDSGSTWDGNLILPLAKITIDDGKISKIDKVYNGFSEVGSYLFVFPGVAGYEGNGFNNDNSYKNRHFLVENLEKASVNSYETVFAIRQTNDSFYLTTRSGRYAYVKDRDEMYDIGLGGAYYVEKENKVYSWGGTGYSEYDVGCVLGYGIRTNGVLDFRFETDIFSSGKRIDYLSKMSQPSKKYQTITLGASGASYTMNYTGTLYIGMTSGAAGETIKFQNTTSGLQKIVVSQDSGIYYTASIPVSIGDKVTLSYSMATFSGPFRLILTKGDELCF